jgi:aspartyl-tRNA(Asn)/glutamyl-tRNA(Gln) amidotransferase subunit A
LTRGPGDLDAAGAAAAVASGRITVADLLEDARSRTAHWEPWLQAVVGGVWSASGDGAGPLHGVVVGVKDLVAVAGHPRECGAPAVVGSAPQPADATVVERLAAAGCSIAARLALHPLAFGIITPQTRNPRAPDRVAGGSSGGSAAALAAGLVHGAVGTDTGGSIRIPAACCGVVGLKPTRGLVPLSGVQPLAHSLDTVGPMAATVADVALLLEVMRGHDPADPYSEPAPPAARRPPEPLTVGVPRQIVEARMDADVRRVWEATLDGLARAGATVRDADLPALVDASLANGRILTAEAAAVHGAALAADPDPFPTDVRSRLEAGLALRAHVVAEARHHGAVLRNQLRAVLRDVDVLVTPTLPCRVPPVGAEEVEVDGEREPVTPAMTRFTNIWNLTGVPAGSVPAGVDAAGAPIGMQVIGGAFDDATVLAAMALLESVRGGPWPAVDPMAPA